MGAAVPLFILSACMPGGGNDPPGCEVGPAGTGAVCAWGVNYQNAAGRPLVGVAWLPHGGTWQHTNFHNCNDFDDGRGVCSIAVYSPTGFASVNEQSIGHG